MKPLATPDLTAAVTAHLRAGRTVVALLRTTSARETFVRLFGSVQGDLHVRSRSLEGMRADVVVLPAGAGEALSSAARAALVAGGSGAPVILRWQR